MNSEGVFCYSLWSFSGNVYGDEVNFMLFFDAGRLNCRAGEFQFFPKLSSLASCFLPPKKSSYWKDICK